MLQILIEGDKFDSVSFSRSVYCNEQVSMFGDRHAEELEFILFCENCQYNWKVWADDRIK